ncbi:MAG TPA: hypothetical protein VIE16_08555 [Phenylobacterium sp.]|jgi:hypothetical protein
MRLLGLPGRLPSTFPAMQALAARLTGAGDTARVQPYGFWGGDFTNPDVEPEAAIAGGSGAERIVALSIGCLVAMRAHIAHGLRPCACVFIGAPVRRLAAEGRLDLLARQAHAVPTLFVQRTADPTGAFAELAAALPHDGQLRELAGEIHAYEDVETLAAMIEAWPPWTNSGR